MRTELVLSSAEYQNTTSASSNLPTFLRQASQ
eukprot:CAMPEP_0115349888 /NCGR_PEP_ID=MMETSP0270-20121206/96175_1 /TAXON_ID=71861 /ORGANISM="Scrippsiella trochoidea, Strain CCMP3099" /LENGTH=31 /DNA_ID= /DNA_START= /DNA_END= /DNA_ORIENTATION=